ncbi:MAG: DUF4070 domain-containing protein [Bacteroidetes bacterium]|nr:DUF4070 domain-containing protein [Bacteroidota bacterium]
MNILLVYPIYPNTFWSFNFALRFISKKAASPPLGLITVSAMLPKSWKKKLIDLNVRELKKEELEWADYVFISAMVVQKKSVELVIQKCLQYDVKIVAGGPLFTQEYENYPGVDHFVLNEAEITLPEFLKDIEAGTKLKHIYRTKTFANMVSSPVPDYHLLDMKSYAFMNLQVSRGCPFACDFCEITALLGHKVRMKSTQQVLNELDVLYGLRWRGPIAIVDDNFIGRKKQIKEDLLPAIFEWMKAHKHPFTFNTQTSINIADDKQLVADMTRSGFSSTFIGIETPDEVSLHGCNKVQNENRDLLESVRSLQRAGMQVSAGFIVGFDSDTPSVFQRQIDFIHQSGIVSAMVGLLNAPKNTKLYQRLYAEHRLAENTTGSNTDYSMNFNPKMDKTLLLKGYDQIIDNIYSIKPYYMRVRRFFNNYEPFPDRKKKIRLSHVKGFIRSLFILGLLRKGRREYWKLIIWTLYRKPALLVEAVTLTIYGYHFRKSYGLIS